MISDFLSRGDESHGNGYEKALKTLRRRHEIVGVRVFDTGAFHLPKSGMITFEDFETGETCLLDAGDKWTRRWFTETKTAVHSETTQVFSRARIDLVELNTADSTSDVLTRYFRLRERRQG